MLKYGAILWNFHCQHEIEVFKNVQEKFVYLVFNNSILSDLPSLERRRNNQTLLLFYNILHNNCHLDPNNFFLINHHEPLLSSWF